MIADDTNLILISFLYFLILFNMFLTVQFSDNALKISKHSNIVCYTMGSKGVKIIFNGKVRHIETIKIQYIDETGAGDVWGTSFIIFYYLMRKDLYESAFLSNISASLSVEGFSHNKIATYKQILSYK